MIAYKMNAMLLAMPSHRSRRIDLTEKVQSTRLLAR